MSLRRRFPFGQAPASSRPPLRVVKTQRLQLPAQLVQRAERMTEPLVTYEPPESVLPFHAPPARAVKPRRTLSAWEAAIVALLILNAALLVFVIHRL